jgi:hypothetical protein
MWRWFTVSSLVFCERCGEDPLDGPSLFYGNGDEGLLGRWSEAHASNGGIRQT